MLQIAVTSRQSSLRISADQLVRACEQILAENGFSSAELSLAVVGDAEMQQLNRQFLAHDYPTDVLSFPLQITDEHLAGEVIVSADTALSNAAAYGTMAEEELLLYVVHGTLHLVGLRDKSPHEAARMREAEHTWLEKLGVPRVRVAKLVYPDRDHCQHGESEPGSEVPTGEPSR